MAWQGDRPAGSVLYASGKRTLTANVPTCDFECSDDYTRFDFTPLLHVIPSEKYVAFLSVAEFLTMDADSAGRLWTHNGNSSPTTDAYVDGVMVVWLRASITRGVTRLG
jgi:hypothetical protein